MIPHETDETSLIAWLSRITPWAATLMLAASIDRLWLLLPEDSDWGYLLVAAPLALLVIAGLFAQRTRARTRRWQAALDAYARRELSRMTPQANHRSDGRSSSRGLMRRRIAPPSRTAGRYRTPA